MIAPLTLTVEYSFFRGSCFPGFRFGCPILPGVWEGSGGSALCSATTVGPELQSSFLYASETQTLLRTARSALHHLQLPPAAAVVGIEAGAQFVCENLG